MLPRNCFLSAHEMNRCNINVIINETMHDLAAQLRRKTAPFIIQLSSDSIGRGGVGNFLPNHAACEPSPTPNPPPPVAFHAALVKQTWSSSVPKMCPWCSLHFIRGAGLHFQTICLPKTLQRPPLPLPFPAHLPYTSSSVSHICIGLVSFMICIYDAQYITPT